MELKQRYEKQVIPAMIEKFGYRSVMAVPRITKVIVNSGIGRMVTQSQAGGPEAYKKMLDEVRNFLSLICGQRPRETVARKSISAFKVREGMPSGFKVTLRAGKMYDFLERLINIALPRSRDFRGIDPKSVGSYGNLTIGIKECTIFPEISSENIRNIFGLEVTVVTTAKTREKGLELLKLMGFPIKSS